MSTSVDRLKLPFTLIRTYGIMQGTSLQNILHKVRWRGSERESKREREREREKERELHERSEGTKDEQKFAQTD